MLSRFSIAFDVIQAIGLASTCIILLTVSFNAHLRRLPTWYLIMGSGVLYYASQLLLALTGTQDGHEPDFNLCAIQAVLIYSAPIAVIASGASFALQFYITALFFVKQQTGVLNKNHKLFTIVPCIIFLLSSAGLLIAVYYNQHWVERTPELFYCHLKSAIGMYVVGGFSIACALAAIPVEAMTIRLLYAHWYTARTQWRNSPVSLANLARLLAFTITFVISTTVGVIYLVPNRQNYEYTMLATSILNQIGILTIGMHQAVLETWMFWRKKEPVVYTDGETKSSMMAEP